MTMVRFLASAVEILGMKTAEEVGSCRSGEMSSRCRCRCRAGAMAVVAGDLAKSSSGSWPFVLVLELLLRVYIFLTVGGLILGWPWEFLLDQDQ